MQGAKALAAVFAKDSKDAGVVKKTTGKYVLVDEPDSPQATAVPSVKDENRDQKSDQKQLAIPETMRMAMGHLKMTAAGKRTGKRGGIGGIRKPFSANVAARFTAIGTGNTALTTVETLQPNNTSSVTEASNFSTLFDEWRCLAFTVYMRVMTNTGTVSTPPSAWASVYDPANAGPYTSVVGALLSTQHIGPVAMYRPNDSGMMEFTSNGYVSKTFKVPSALPSVTISGNPAVVGRSWTATTDITSSIGYLKIYVDPLGSGVIPEWDLFVVYHMQYRSRT